MQTTSAAQSAIDPAALLPESWDLARDALLLIGEGSNTIAQAFIRYGLKRVITMYPPPLVPEPQPPGTICIQTRAELTQTIRSFSQQHPFQYAVIVSPDCSLPSEVTKGLEQRFQNLLLNLPGRHSPPQRLTRHWAINGVQNLDHLSTHPMVHDLGDAFAGMPVIIVGAGPSLAKNIDLLKAAQDKCVILCVNRALRSLQRAGIWPDLAINIETQDVMCQFTDIDMHRIPGLFLSSTSHPPLFDIPGPQIFSYPGPRKYQGWMYDPEDQVVEIDGLSVTCTAMSTAVALGFDPIILVGQDLSFSGGDFYHSNGADGEAKAVWNEAEQCWQLTNYSDDLAHTLKGNMPEDGPRYPHASVPGYYGGQVPTSIQFAGFRHFLESTALDHQGQITMYNCTEGGAYIGGMDHVPLKDVLASLPARTVDVRDVLSDSRVQAAAQQRRDTLQGRFQQFRQEVRTAHALSARVMELIDQSLAERRNIPELQEVATAASSIQSATRLVILMDQSSIRNAVAAEKKATRTEEALQASRRIYSTIHTQLGQLLEADAHPER